MRSTLVFLKISLKQITSCFSSNRIKNTKSLTDDLMEKLLLFHADACVWMCVYT